MERDMNLKRKEGRNFCSMKVNGPRPSFGIYVYTRPFRIESKGKLLAGTSHFGDAKGFRLTMKIFLS
jgi:hypothetical protein